jgi:CRISPR-associated protein Cmr5
MKNLEQHRAASALSIANNVSRSSVSKLPALILNNGLLATAAFCQSKKDNDLQNAMKGIAKYLTERGIINGQGDNIDSMISSLTGVDFIYLQRATTESLAYLSYLKRFAASDKNN